MQIIKSKTFLLIGILAGILTGGGWLAWAAIQSEIGMNIFIPSTGAWVRVINVFTNADGQSIPATSGGILDVQSMGFNFNGATYDRIRNAGIGDAAASTGINASAGYAFNGATFDRLRSSSNAADALATSSLGNINSISFPFVFNGTTWDRVRDSTTVQNTTGTGLPAVGGMLRDSTTGLYSRMANAAGLASDGNSGASLLVQFPWRFNGTTYDRTRSISATNLTATTSTGSSLNVPLSTWSVTHTPAAATQATASKAAGGGTVRHVATTITACSAQAGTAQTPIAINLRDGATGAGTVLRTWKISSIIQDSKCVEASGLAMIGTANTAMTIEFAAAGVAASEQTVTLTGFSVP